MAKLNLTLRFTKEADLMRVANHPKLIAEHGMKVSYISLNRETNVGILTISADLSDEQRGALLQLLGLSRLQEG